MSVLIKGFNLPSDCKEVSVRLGGVFYPLVQLPDHGDLVDKDKLMMKMWEASAYAPNHCSWVNARVVFAKDIEDAPVVIPAERSEDE